MDRHEINKNKNCVACWWDEHSNGKMLLTEAAKKETGKNKQMKLLLQRICPRRVRKKAQNIWLKWALCFKIHLTFEKYTIIM